MVDAYVGGGTGGPETPPPRGESGTATPAGGSKFDLPGFGSAVKKSLTDVLSLVRTVRTEFQGLRQDIKAIGPIAGTGGAAAGRGALSAGVFSVFGAARQRISNVAGFTAAPTPGAGGGGGAAVVPAEVIPPRPTAGNSISPTSFNAAPRGTGPSTAVVPAPGAAVAGPQGAPNWAFGNSAAKFTQAPNMAGIAQGALQAASMVNTQGGGGGDRNSAASVSAPPPTGVGGGGPPSPPAGGAGGTGGGGGGGVGMLGLAALGDVAGGYAGYINQKQNQLMAGNTGIQAMASMQAMGRGLQAGGAGTGTRSMVNMWTQNGANLGAADLNQAMSMSMTNPVLTGATYGGGANSRNYQAFLRGTSTAFNMSATQAAQMGAELTSPQASRFFQMYNPQGGLFNPMRGGQINRPQQTYASTVQALMGGQRVTGRQMQLLARDPGSMIRMSQNAQMMGLDPNAFQAIQQFMLSGGNMQQLQRTQGTNLFQTGMRRAAAGTQTGMTITEETTRLQNAINDLATRLQHLAQHVPSSVYNIGLAGSQIAKLGAHALEAVAAFEVIKKIFGSLGGGGGGRGGGTVGTGLAGLINRLLALFGRGRGGKGAAGSMTVAVDDASINKLCKCICGCIGKEKEPGAAPSQHTAPTSHRAQPKQKGGGTGFWGHVENVGRDIAIGGQALYKAGKWVYGKFPKGGAPGEGGGIPAPPDIPVPVGDPGQQPITGAGLTGLRSTDVGTLRALALGGPNALKTRAMGDSPTGSTTTSGMMPNLARGITAMKAANPAIKISSGFRSKKQQQTLYNLKMGDGVARPGQSPHQVGKAADIGPPSQFGWIARNAPKFGLKHVDRSEPWHVQAMGDPNIHWHLGMGDPVWPVGSGLTQGRVDQGVDWSGKGPILAVASGTILSLYNAGWPGGTFIALKLDNPPDQQHTIVYYAEDITPMVQVGQHVNGGQQIGEATGGGTGIEIGWGSTSIGQSLQANSGPYAGSGSTPQGQAFLLWLMGGGTGSGTSTGGTQASSTTTNQVNTSNVGPVGLGNSFVSSMSSFSLFGGVTQVGPSASAFGSSQNVPNTAGGAGAGGGSGGTGAGQQAVVAAVKGVTGVRNVQIAMLTGADMESNQNPTAVGQGSYGAWQIQQGQGVSIQQAEDPNFAAQWIVGRYTAAVQGEGNMWSTNPQGAAGQAAFQAERPAAMYSAARVAAGYQLAVSEVGPPTGDPAKGLLDFPTTAVGLQGSGPAFPSGVDTTGTGSATTAAKTSAGPGTGVMGKGNRINVQVGPIYVQGTQQDANNIASMVARAIQSNQEIAQVSSS